MPMKFGAEFEVEHPPSATRFDSANPSIQKLTYMSQGASRSLPKKRKERVDSEGVRGIPKALTATAEQARVGIQCAYSGTKKPVLVLDFVAHGDGFYCPLNTGIEIRILRGKHHGKYDYTAFLIRFDLEANTEHVLFSGERMESAFEAFKNLTNRQRWFYHGGQWRSLWWVYRHVLCTGFGKMPKMPPQYESFLYHAPFLHVEGAWCWEEDKIATTPLPREVVLPKNNGQRFWTDENGNPVEPMPALRSSERFIQDVDKHGKTTRTHIGNTRRWTHVHSRDKNKKYTGKQNASVPQTGSFIETAEGSRKDEVIYRLMNGGNPI